MANRVLRDGIRKSEAVNGLHDSTYRLYTFLLLVADDYGLVDISYGGVMEAAPLRQYTREEVAKMLGELTDSGLIYPYKAGNQSLAALAKWQGYVNSIKPRHAPPPQGLIHCLNPLGYKNASTRERASLLLKHLQTDSGPPVAHQYPTSGPMVPEEVRSNKEEVKDVPIIKQRTTSGPPTGVEVGTDQGMPKRGTRLPKDWALPDEWQDWAMAYCKEQGLQVPPSLVIEWSLRFADYWREVPGQKGVKLSWSGTWRNAVKDWYAPKAPRIQTTRPALRGV